MRLFLQLSLYNMCTIDYRCVWQISLYPERDLQQSGLELPDIINDTASQNLFDSDACRDERNEQYQSCEDQWDDYCPMRIPSTAIDDGYIDENGSHHEP